VRSIEEIGEHPISVLGTSEATYIANGFIAHNSTIFEFAATGRPVVVVNCPRYRRDVSHGLRFWDDIPGLQCDAPDELPSVIERALKDPPVVRAMREAAVANVYSKHDGHSAERFAAVIVEQIGRYPEIVPAGAPAKDLRPFKVMDGDRVVAEYATSYEADTHATKRGLTVATPAGL